MEEVLQPTLCSSVSFLYVCAFVYLFRIFHSSYIHYSNAKVFCIYLALINRDDGKPRNQPFQQRWKRYIKRNGHSAEIISSILMPGYLRSAIYDMNTPPMQCNAMQGSELKLWYSFFSSIGDWPPHCIALHRSCCCIFFFSPSAFPPFCSCFFAKRNISAGEWHCRS